MKITLKKVEIPGSVLERFFKREEAEQESENNREKASDDITRNFT